MWAQEGPSDKECFGLKGLSEAQKAEISAAREGTELLPLNGMTEYLQEKAANTYKKWKEYNQTCERITRKIDRLKNAQGCDSPEECRSKIRNAKEEAEQLTSKPVSDPVWKRAQYEEVHQKCREFGCPRCP
jgi:molecular chaperone DnaK (HSP70)